MKLVKKILRTLNGLHYSQEYLCFANESFQHPLRAYLVNGRQILSDITDSHSFNGYSPLIFTLYSLPTGLGQLPVISILFSTRSMNPNDIFQNKDAIASLTLKKIYSQPVENDTLCYYEATRGTHRFLHAFQQFTIALDNRLFNKKPGNVFLAGNLYKQVQIAYALPRIISLITVGQDGLFNLFPTDLHGAAGKKHYVISLRHEGKACMQVEMSGKIIISRVEAGSYKTVFGLGKNHMRELRTRDQFPFEEDLSTIFQLPVPAFALSYKELALENTLQHGIHKLMLFRILSGQELTAAPSTLAHIHNVYATWRHNNHLEGNYLMR